MVVWLVLPGTQSSLVVMLVITHTLNSVRMSLQRLYKYRLCGLLGGLTFYNEACSSLQRGWIYVGFTKQIGFASSVQFFQQVWARARARARALLLVTQYTILCHKGTTGNV